MTLAANLVANMDADGLQAPKEKLEELYDNLLNYDAFYEEMDAEEPDLLPSDESCDGSSAFFFIQDEELQ